MNALQCYTRDELKDFVLGNLPETIAISIGEHLDECGECGETVVGLDRTSDTLISLLSPPEPSVEESATYEPASEIESLAGVEHNDHLQAALNQLLKLDPEKLIGDAAQPDPAGFAAFQTVAPVRLGDYEIVKTIGRGGMGSVYLAKHLRLEKSVAIKILPRRRMRNLDAIARFKREMKIVGHLDHPAMVNATDAGEVDGTHYLVMELVDGKDLGRLVRYCGPLTISDACELIRQAALGIAYAHEKSVIHRDVKPSNLMLGRDARVKVLDLGLATLSGLNENVDELTTVGQMMGTLDYMAPEQAGNDFEVDSRSDIYGLAATLYKLLTGFAPYSRPDLSTPLKKLKAMATEDPLPIRKRNAELPAALAAAVDRSLSRNPADRIQSAEAFAKSVEPFTSGHALGTLLERAELLAETNRVIDVADDANFGAEADAPAQAKPVTRGRLGREPLATATNRQRGWFSRAARAAILLAAIGGFCWGGIVLYLDTISGRLVIESDVDNVEVTVLRDAEPAKELRVEHGAEATKLYAGKYQIRINGPSDGLVITNESFELRRGQTVVARIRKSAPSGGAGRPPTAFNSTEPSKLPSSAGARADLTAKLLSELFDLEAQLILSAKQYGPKHQTITDLAEKIALRRNQLDWLNTAPIDSMKSRSQLDVDSTAEKTTDKLAQPALVEPASAPAQTTDNQDSEPTFKGRNFDAWRSTMLAFLLQGGSRRKEVAQVEAIVSQLALKQSPEVIAAAVDSSLRSIRWELSADAVSMELEYALTFARTDKELTALGAAAQTKFEEFGSDRIAQHFAENLFRKHHRFAFKFFERLIDQSTERNFKFLAACHRDGMPLAYWVENELSKRTSDPNTKRAESAISLSEDELRNWYQRLRDKLLQRRKTEQSLAAKNAILSVLFGNAKYAEYLTDPVIIDLLAKEVPDIAGLEKKSRYVKLLVWTKPQADVLVPELLKLVEAGQVSAEVLVRLIDRNEQALPAIERLLGDPMWGRGTGAKPAEKSRANGLGGLGAGLGDGGRLGEFHGGGGRTMFAPIETTEQREGLVRGLTQSVPFHSTTAETMRRLIKILEAEKVEEYSSIKLEQVQRSVLRLQEAIVKNPELGDKPPN